MFFPFWQSKHLTDESSRVWLLFLLWDLIIRLYHVQLAFAFNITEEDPGPR